MNEVFDKNKEPQATYRLQIEITWKSVFRLLIGILLAYTAVLLWPIFKMLILATLIAVALQPIVAWTTRRGGPPWVGVLLSSATLVIVLVGCCAIIAPLIFHQIASLGEDLPRLREQIIAQLPSSGPVRQALENGMSPGTVADSRLVLERALVLVRTAMGGLVSLVVVVALAVYLLLEGSRALKWLLVFFPVGQRAKIAQALSQISSLVSSYVAGQCLISAFCAAYLFLVLNVLNVPMALLLGIVAGICDILPIIGFFIAVLLAMAISFAISPNTAMLVFVLYGAYHLFENFFIVPRVYGKKLKLSKLAVPLAVAVGGLVAGVVGAIAVLPIVAAYPVIEKLWLAPALGPDALKEHEERIT
jgi:predicted PurR-regulated permease PerM